MLQRMAWQKIGDHDREQGERENNGNPEAPCHVG
jgi:hypothetical protein